MMLKTINLFRFNIKCCGKCRSLVNRVSTSAVVQNPEKNFFKEKLKFMEDERKRYEDTFGDIESFERKFERIQDDPEDILEYERQKKAKGKTLLEYKKEISQLLTKHQFKEAKRVLEEDMVNDKIKADIGIYRMLFNYTALKGDLEEAYKLYVRYRKRQGRMTGPMYTSLFNACANCNNSSLALSKAEIIRENLAKDEFHKVNIFNYNSMLKAFGRHGDIPTCLKIFDEVLEKRLKAFTYTYNFLLQSCISDRNSGLRHALLVWRKMLQNRRKPDIYFFNLFLRCVRDCSLGDVELIPDLIKQINKESGKFFKKKVVMKKIKGELKRNIITVPVDGSDFVKFIEQNASKCEEKNEKSGSGKLEAIEIGDLEHSRVTEELETSELTLKETSQLQLVADEGTEELGLSKNEELDGSFDEGRKESGLSRSEELDDSLDERRKESGLSRNEELDGSFDEGKKESGLSRNEELDGSFDEGMKGLELNKNEELDGSCEAEENIPVLESLEVKTPEKNYYELPDLMALKPATGSVINFGSMSEPHHRIMLFGGVMGFLETMAKFGVQPNARTFSLLLSLTPPISEAEQKIIELSKSYGIQLDAPFFSEFIKKKIFTGRSALIKDCLNEMQKAKVHPDLICFGVLAFGCKTHEMGMELLETLKTYGYRPNCEILYGLLHSASYARDLVYVKAILDVAKVDNVELDSKFIAKLGKLIRREAQKRREAKD